MQGKHYKSRGLKRKIVAPVLAAVLLASTAVPAITAGFRPATAASVDGKSVGLASNEYNAPVNSSNSANNNLYWADATYFDYLSDAEISNGWLNTVKAGTGFNGSVDEWYPYYNFNRDVVKNVADNNTSWATPLYFGNFCNTPGAYDTAAHHVGGKANYGSDGIAYQFKDATDRTYNIAGNQTFNYAANNSNGLSNYNQSYQGLMGNALDASGNLLTPDGTKAPYFDKDLLTGNKASNAKVVNSKFPFRTFVENGVTKYEFDSTGGRDNVYFDWSGSKPTNVNYGGGEAYAVRDGLRYFMYDQGSGYGIFPFNNRGTTKTVTKPTGTRYVYLSKSDWTLGWGGAKVHFIDANANTVGSDVTMSLYNGNWRAAIPANAVACKFYDTNSTGYETPYATDLAKAAFYYNDTGLHLWAEVPSDSGIGASVADNEVLDYGFGIHTEMNFRVPNGGKDKAGNDITFTYSGDDDLWVYITDLTTQTSQLVLDLGGNHKMATGSINFSSLKATADSVYQHGKVETPFEFNYSHSYKMSIFYMERGMLESNCKMTFSMVPLGNEVAVTEFIDTTDINDGLKTAVEGVDEFTFRPLAGTNGTTPVSNLSYIGNGESKVMSGNTFNLGSKSAAYFNNVFTTGDIIKVEQTQQTNSYLTYNSAWTFTDNVGTQQVTTGYQENIGSGYATDTKQLINSTTNPDYYEFAALQADFVNKPKSADVTITKTLTGLATGETDNTEFDATITVQLKSGESFTGYPLTYTISDSNRPFTLSESGQLASGAKLKNGRTLTFKGLPVGAKIQVKENISASQIGYEYKEVTGNTNITPVSGGGIFAVPEGGAAIIVSNDKPVQEGTGVITISKTVDGKKYTGDAFSFQFIGLEEGVVGGGHTFVDMSGKSYPATSVDNGTVSFNLTFNEAGWYCFLLAEDKPNDDRYNFDENSYFVQFEVVRDASSAKLKIASSGSGVPVFYRLNETTGNYVSIGNSLTINNTVKPAEISIMKTNQSNEPLNDTRFMIVKVLSEIDSVDYDTKINEFLNSLSQAQGLGWAVADKNYFLGVTQTDGSLKFSNLPIYQNGDMVYDLANSTWEFTDDTAQSTLVSQTYMVFEYSPKNGYNTNKTVKFVTFPYQNGYKITFDEFINIAVISPATGGFAQVFVPVGAGVLGGSLLLAGAYVLYNKKSRAKRKVRHGRRFK